VSAIFAHACKQHADRRPPEDMSHRTEQKRDGRAQTVLRLISAEDYSISCANPHVEFIRCDNGVPRQQTLALSRHVARPSRRLPQPFCEPTDKSCGDVLHDQYRKWIVSG